MRKRYFSIFLSVRILCCLSIALVVKGQNNPLTDQQVKEWYSKGQWRSGLTLKPDASIDQREFARQYQANKTLWDKALAFLRDKNLDSLPAGNYVIDGQDVFADITETPSSPLDQAKWHSHKRYCDIQYVIKGKERVGVAPIQGAPIVAPFNDKGDSQFYDQNMKGNYYETVPGTFFIFFPSDVHRPFIKVDGAGEVKRIRFKVKSA